MRRRSTRSTAGGSPPDEAGRGCRAHRPIGLGRSVGAVYLALSRQGHQCGEVPEWLNGAVSKTVERERVPRVRIPLSPPTSLGGPGTFGRALNLPQIWRRSAGFSLRPPGERDPENLACPVSPPIGAHFLSCPFWGYASRRRTMDSDAVTVGKSLRYGAGHPKRTANRSSAPDAWRLARVADDRSIRPR